MRALVVLAVFSSLLVLAVSPPQVGLFAWGWLTLMQPHREAWGLGNANLNLIVALVTIVLWLLSKEPKRPPGEPTSVFIILFMLWMGVSQIFSLRPEYSWYYFNEFIRVMIFVYLSMILVRTKARIHAMVLILCISIGFYSVKGGIFTILTGGGHHVLGPMMTMIADRNHMGGAAVFILPLLNYIRMQTEVFWIRILFLFSIVLTVFAALGTHSRGAFIALALIAVPFWWRSRHRLMLAVVLLPLAVGALNFMPESWSARMQSIAAAGEDSSFQGRVDAWIIATEIALRNPLTGGGFRVAYLQDVADAYLSEPRQARAAHSIYFEILGSMGFVGLALFVSIIVLAFRNASWIRRHTKDQSSLQWARDLASMAQISLMAYCIAGAALSLEFWEGPWLMFVILARLRYEISAHVKEINSSIYKPLEVHNEYPAHGLIESSGVVQGAKIPRC
ncbi:MAG: putative O-glycosylation ligase, exosortase A system-associated, partial [Limisphaerales bacterium]